MAANIFGCYVWLIEQFRHYGRLTFEEITSVCETGLDNSKLVRLL